MNNEKIANVIKKIRIDNNLTQKEFADIFGISYQAVSKWERGINMPDILILKEICNKYNYDINDLLNGTKKKRFNIINYVIILLLLFVIIFLVIILNKDSKFEFKNLSANCNNFLITGSIAYNKNISSIYISDINYCGNEDNNLYKYISCTLYESDGNTNTKIDFYEVNNVNTTLEDFLKDLQFKIDDYEKECKSYRSINLFLEIDAYTIDNNHNTYKIPLTLNDNC